MWERATRYALTYCYCWHAKCRCNFLFQLPLLSRVPLARVWCSAVVYHSSADARSEEGLALLTLLLGLAWSFMIWSNLLCFENPSLHFQSRTDDDIKVLKCSIFPKKMSLPFPFSCSTYSPMNSVEFSLVLTQIESGPCVFLIPRPPAAQFVRAVKNVGVEPKGPAERKWRVWTGLRWRTKQDTFNRGRVGTTSARYFFITTSTERKQE